MPVSEKTRKAAVAGRFYPLAPGELREEVGRYLAAAPGAGDKAAQNVSVIVAPHAGYVYSAPVAAAAYARVSRGVKTVFLIGPSHHKWFDGLHVSGAERYETPLGAVEVDQGIVGKLTAHPLCLRAQGAEEKEHCLEVQLPFLQAILGEFKIVPLITGKVSAKAVADMLLPFLDDTALLVASSDLSHYLPQDRARESDDATVSTVLSGDADGFMDACGETAMRVAMRVAAQKGLSAELLDARTSYETAPEHGDSARVVGYAAIAFVKGGADGGAEDFSPQEKNYLLGLARKTLESAVRGEDSRPPKPDTARLARNYGCFVTLNSRGRLRGCIGNIEPVKPLYKSVYDNTINAAFHDPRFPKVRAEELGDITIEVSALTRPAPLEFSSPEDLLSKLAPLEHGVILKMGARQSTFLPQVWEQLPDKVMFLEHLAMKAGAGKDEWKRAEVWVYKAVHFKE